MKKIIIITILIIGIWLVFIQIKKSRRQRSSIVDKQQAVSSQRKILYYTCGMHPSVRSSVSEYKKGNKSCPICNMFLTPVYEKGIEENVLEKNVLSLSQREISLAGIETSKINILPLFKEIRTVGVIAYDPQLRAAEEEYIQALNTYEKISQSEFKDAKVRAKESLDAARLKLELLGIDKEWIKELVAKRIPHKSLILPDRFIWIYSDVYEYEAIWPQVGNEVEVVSEVDPSVRFVGVIKSIEPVVKERTRTLRLKIIAENTGNILKPNMYVDVFLKSDLGETLSIPKEAVLDTGKRTVAYVDLGNGRYQAREVKIGPLVQSLIGGKKRNFYPLIDGIEEGENVVSKGNFLINSQSQIGTAVSAYGGALRTEQEEMKPLHQH